MSSFFIMAVLVCLALAVFCVMTYIIISRRKKFEAEQLAVTDYSDLHLEDEAECALKYYDDDSFEEQLGMSPSP